VGNKLFGVFIVVCILAVPILLLANTAIERGPGAVLSKDVAANVLGAAVDRGLSRNPHASLQFSAACFPLLLIVGAIGVPIVLLGFRSVSRGSRDGYEVDMPDDRDPRFQ